MMVLFYAVTVEATVLLRCVPVPIAARRIRERISPVRYERFARGEIDQTSMEFRGLSSVEDGK